MERKIAIELLEKHLNNRNLIKHCIATEAAMENFGLPLEQFLEIVLKGMRKRSEEPGF